tara:strand:- start:453 stop:815 length:363 start_codon:yes stop_codon:yes gene_type:complete
MVWKDILKNEDDEKRTHSLSGEDLNEPAILDENMYDYYADLVNDLVNDGHITDQIDNLSSLAQEITDLAYEVKEQIWNHDNNPIGERLNGEEIHEGHELIQPINELIQYVDEQFGGVNPW